MIEPIRYQPIPYSRSDAEWLRRKSARPVKLISGRYPTEHGSCEPYITVEV